MILKIELITDCLKNISISEILGLPGWQCGEGHRSLASSSEPVVRAHFLSGMLGEGESQRVSL